MPATDARDADIPLPAFLPPEDGEAAPAEADARAPAKAVSQDEAESATGEAPAGKGKDARAEGRGMGQELARAVAQERESALRAEWRARVEGWRKEVENDAELGGERFETSVLRAQLALSRFDEGGKIGRLLENSGYGNHPDIVRFFNRLADAIMEDVPARGGQAEDLAPLEERMYGGWHS